MNQIANWAFCGIVGLGALFAAGCATTNTADAQGPSLVSATPQPMPNGETWVGVYYHPVFGYLHIIDQGTSVVGRWKRTDQSAWGELSGKKTGNLLHFTWREHKYGMLGPAALLRGKGIFAYKMGTNHIAELDGTYGVDDDESGSEWHNVKQANMKPDLNSINGAPIDDAVPQKWE